jgi:hypothetical protein
MPPTRSGPTLLLALVLLTGACGGGEDGPDGNGGIDDPCPDSVSPAVTPKITVRDAETNVEAQVTTSRTLGCASHVTVARRGTANLFFGDVADCSFNRFRRQPGSLVTRDPSDLLFRMDQGRARCTFKPPDGARQRVNICDDGELEAAGPPAQATVKCIPDPAFIVAVYRGTLLVTDPDDDLHEVTEGFQLRYSFRLDEAIIRPAHFTAEEVALFAEQAEDLDVTFERATLEVVASGPGTVTGPGISCGADCTEDYALGTPISIAATPADGSQFTGWSGGCSGTAPTCELEMDESKSATATFAEIAPEIEYPLRVDPSGFGRVIGEGIDCGSDCAESYAGGSVRLSAIPETGWLFLEWKGDCEGTDPTCVILMDAPRVVSAIFLECTIMVPDGGGTVTGTAGEDVICGESSTLATSIDGLGGDDFIFAGSGNDTINGGDGADILLGADGNDTIDGGAGNDRIDGGGGADALEGGTDVDSCTGGEIVTGCES